MTKKVAMSSIDELEAAKMEVMRIRFRRVLGESVPPHKIRSARKNVAKCVRLLQSGEVKDA
ncbi:MAG: 50S ribosomal protein L29 [Holosporaceae bacterium]|jgi:ribosomal protein L29|nr:50S ribosomal protein L29 [Holosporaceae bacterium]